MDRINGLVSICITCIDLGDTNRFGNGMDESAAINITMVDHVVSLLIVWLHRANIERLFKGTENRFGKKGVTK